MVLHHTYQQVVIPTYLITSITLNPGRILLQHSIPTSLWFEKAIGRYGVPTVVFDLHILMPDIEQA